MDTGKKGKGNAKIKRANMQMLSSVAVRDRHKTCESDSVCVSATRPIDGACLQGLGTSVSAETITVKLAQKALKVS